MPSTPASSARCFLHPASLPAEILDNILSFLPLAAQTPFDTSSLVSRSLELPTSTSTTAPRDESQHVHTIPWSATKPPGPCTAYLYLPLSLTCRDFYHVVRPWIYRDILLIPGNFPFSYRISLLIRTILTCRGDVNVAEYIRSVEVQRVKFQHKLPMRVKELVYDSGTGQRHMVWERFDIDELERRLWGEADLAALSGELAALSGGGEGDAARVVEQVVEGEVPEVLVGVLVGLLAKRGRGRLRELRVTLSWIDKLKGPAETWKEKTEALPPSDFLWRVLDHVIPPASSFSSPSSPPFPHLTTVQITATRAFRSELATYEPSLQPILLPLLRLPALSHLSIATRERDSFEPLDPPASPNPALTHLTLGMARPDALNAILALTPNLTTLDLTFCMQMYTWHSTYTTVFNAALQLVKGTLRELSIFFRFEGFADAFVAGHGPGQEAGFPGDGRALRLRECAGLRKLTVALSVLLGRFAGEGRVTVAELLPDGLEELWISRPELEVWYDETAWEGWLGGNHSRMEAVLGEYMRARGAGAGAGSGNGSLVKVGVLRFVGETLVHDDDADPEPWWHAEQFDKVRRVADECGVVCEWNVPRMWRREALWEMFELLYAQWYNSIRMNEDEQVQYRQLAL